MSMKGVSVIYTYMHLHPLGIFVPLTLAMSLLSMTTVWKHRHWKQDPTGKLHPADGWTYAVAGYLIFYTIAGTFLVAVMFGKM
jgi:hypothetical protein